jgi:polar amino acid transport system substrate-binding protein
VILFSLSEICKAEETGKILTIDDCNNKRIGVYTGTIYDKFAVKRFPSATILRYNSISDFVLALMNNKIDVAISNLYSAKNVIKTNPEIGILTDDVLSFDIGIGFSKNNSVLREKFNQFLARIKSDGSFDSMYDKWFNHDIETLKMPRFEKNHNNNKVILGVAVGDLPNAGYVKGEYIGFDVELLQTFANSEKMNLEIITMEFGALIAALSAGKVDIIADCIAITDERKERVDFSDPYMQDKSAIIALNINLQEPATPGIKNITVDEIARKKIGVLQGSVHDSYMAKNFREANVLQFKSYPDLILAVKSGKADVGFITSLSFKELNKSDSSVEMLVDNVFGVDIGMGFNKDNRQLREAFNSFLKEIKANKVIDDLNRRWFKDGSAEMPVIENKKNNGKLIVGNVSDKGPPYTYVKNNRLVGSDIELVERFGAFLGREIVYSDMEFGNLIAALTTNKVDMIASTLMITDERKMEIDFSDPYYTLNACIFGTKKVEPPPQSFLQKTVQSFYSNLILENRYLLILDGLKITVIISIFALLFGTLLGALICFLRMSKSRILQNAAILYISIMRGLPVLVLLMVIYYIVFAKINISPVLVAIIAFGLNFAAYVSEIFRTAVQGVDKGQTEAGFAGGFTRIQTFIYIVLPQAMRQVIPVYKGEIISLIKTTSIVGYIAVQDLTKAGDIIRSRTFDAFFPLIMTAILYFAISGLLLLLLNTMERRSDPKQRKKASFANTRIAMVAVIIAAVLGSVGIIKVIFEKGQSKSDPITNISQLEGKRICVITGTTGDYAVRGKIKNAHVLDMNYPADAALAVRTNKADAFVFDKSTLHYLVERGNNEFIILPHKLGEAEIAIPMKLGDKKLHQGINAALQKLKDDGTLDSMYTRWFIDNKSGTPTIPEIHLDGINGTLRMGTCLLEEPFAFSSNGKMVGYDIELGYRLAQQLGYKLDIADVTYDAMIMALQTEKIDIAIANFYKMEERNESYEFSIPYLRNDVVAMVRRK